MHRAQFSALMGDWFEPAGNYNYFFGILWLVCKKAKMAFVPRDLLNEAGGLLEAHRGNWQ